MIVHYFLEALKDEEFLEAVTSALRSLLQIMATKNIPQVRTTFIHCFYAVSIHYFKLYLVFLTYVFYWFYPAVYNSKPANEFLWGCHQLWAGQRES